MSIMNMASSGFISTDRIMQDYNKDMEAKTNKQVEVLLEIFVVSTTEIDESLSITNEA